VRTILLSGRCRGEGQPPTAVDNGWATQDVLRAQRDLGATNRDRLDGLDEDEPIAADLMAEVTADRHAAAALGRRIGTYTVARAKRR
jgi:hypothetical protein